MLRFLRCGSCLKVRGSDGEPSGVFHGDTLKLEHAPMYAGDLVVASALHGPARRHVGRLRFSAADERVLVGNVSYRKADVNLWRVASIRPARSRRAA